LAKIKKEASATAQQTLRELQTEFNNLKGKINQNSYLKSYYEANKNEAQKLEQEINRYVVENNSTSENKGLWSPKVIIPVLGGLVVVGMALIIRFRRLKGKKLVK